MKYKRHFSARRFVSLFTGLSFLVLGISGAVLYIDPPGRVAYWTGWKFLGLTKNSWSGLHTIFALLFLLSGSFHVYYNWKSLLFYITSRIASHKRLRGEFLFSILVALLVLIMTLADMPPFRTVIDWGEAISASWEEEQDRPPVPHAEQLTLAEFAEVVQLPLALVLHRLEVAGIRAEDETETLKNLATRYGLSPAELSARILSLSNQNSAAGSHSGIGYGRMTVKELSKKLRVPEARVMAVLSQNGIRAEEHSTLRDLATEHRMLPHEIVSLVEKTLKFQQEENGDGILLPAKNTMEE